MTENERAINTLDAMKKQFLGETRDVLDMAIQALEKVQALEENETYQIYREYLAIGTVDEFKRAKATENVYGQVKWERDVAISQLEEIGISLGQKMDEFKALKEKAEPKEMDRYYCPICRHYFEDTDAYNYCPVCGQKMKSILE